MHFFFSYMATIGFHFYRVVRKENRLSMYLLLWIIAEVFILRYLQEPHFGIARSQTGQFPIWFQQLLAGPFPSSAQERYFLDVWWFVGTLVLIVTSHGRPIRFYTQSLFSLFHMSLIWIAQPLIRIDFCSKVFLILVGLFDPMFTSKSFY